jgi:RHS repeat-associated protein
MLHSLDRSINVGASFEDRFVFYFGRRPVASIELARGSATFQYLSVDHLGTPVLATDGSGSSVWEGGFEPFGRDWLEGRPDGAQESGVFLRFPGQWFDDTWADPSLGAEVVHNVNRWYEFGTGRYSRVDPAFQEQLPAIESVTVHPYEYAEANPLANFDPSGLVTLPLGEVSKRCGRKWERALAIALSKASNIECSGFFDCYLQADLSELLAGGQPLVERHAPSRRSAVAQVRCAGHPGVIRWEPRRFCQGSARTRASQLIHELAHYADCRQRPASPFGKYGGEWEGCRAEEVCFGRSVGGNCPPGFPEIPWSNLDEGE